MKEQEIEVKLDKPLNKEDIHEVAYWLNFASVDIIRVIIDPVTRDRVHVWLGDKASAKNVESKIHSTISRFSSSSSEGESLTRGVKRVGKTPTENSEISGVDVAVEAGIINLLGIADVEIRGILVSLTRGLDKAFRQMGERLGAKERAYSTLLPMEFLEHCHYFDAFPQNIMYPAMMQTDVDMANDFIKKTLENDGRPPRDYEDFADRTHVLAPAACFHVYLANEDEILSENTTVTTVGRCYRYEGRNATILERLWDFQMREIVFLGKKDFVEESRKKTMEEVYKLLDKWELTGVIEVGHDPFFLRGDMPDCEIVSDSKYELRLNLPYNDTDFACASFNNSGTFFSMTSDITLWDGTPAWTGCTAFGLERWAWAIVAQHGVNPEKWPESLQLLLKD